MKKVLIVDDSAFMRLSLRKLLEGNGYQVVGEAENGRVGVDKYKELNPDIVTLDITMPEMDGLAALNEIIQFDREAKVVIVSAMGQEAYVKEAVLSGAKNFVVKPFVNDHVLKVMAQL
ncbi:MAG: response regulator [Firmicutes bacterium]|nr:response regulator [Bacillota bacterium]